VVPPMTMMTRQRTARQKGAQGGGGASKPRRPARVRSKGS
jgi:hypothetical protein